MSARPVIVVEDDPFPRLLQAFLGAEEHAERSAAIEDFVAHDLPDYPGWLARLRARSGTLYPAEVRLAADQAELRNALPQASAVVTESLLVGEAELAAAPHLRAVHKYGSVLRNIDTAACAARGIPVLSVRRRANIATAEHAFTLMLALAKRLKELDGALSIERLRAAGFAPRDFDRRYTSNSNWARVSRIRTLHGATLGIVGLGEIGRELAQRANAFGMQLLYHQRTRQPQAVEHAFNASFRSLPQLLAESDWVCLLVPSNAETRAMIGKAELDRMRRGACLVNVSRAEIVQRQALLEALASGQLGSYGLDTFYEEPADSADPLLNMRNVIVTARTAAQPRTNALGDLEEVIVNLARVLGGAQ
ncbi:MAG: hypothetical protein IT531_02835 [Burkholderiales bacterium]|nr:hypothetical protein [Burkholderiales bacterium]